MQYGQKDILYRLVGINEAMIHAYIEEQGKKDAGQAKLEISVNPNHEVGVS
jgi:hypothetical protein